MILKRGGLHNENKLFKYENNDNLFLGHFIGGDYDYEKDPDLADSDPYPDNYQQAIDNLMAVNELNQVSLLLKDKIFKLSPDHRIPKYMSVELTEERCKLVYQEENHREDTDCYVRIFDDYIYIYSNLSSYFYKRHAFSFYAGVFITKIKINGLY